MTTRPLAATKFSAPPLPSRYVPRPRLHAALDAGSELPLTLVVGVPGAGKSVLLRSWLHDRPALSAVWLSCDSRDSDARTFWLALTAALAQTWPDRWLDVIDLLSEKEPDLDDVAITVVNDLAGLGEPTVLVVDDFQFAAAATKSLLVLIEHLPPGCRVVLGSRTEPQLGLHRFRAYGQCLELRDQELRLTPAEVGAVMREFEVELTQSDLELVARRTEGWMAGVQMAAVALRDGSDADQFLADLAKTPNAIMDFLGTEVLDRQDPEVRDFLLATSVLDVLDPETCAAVSERCDAGELLELLAKRNLFLIDLDGGRHRYHHLFADLLRYRLRREDPSREVALHRRAAAYFEKIGDPERVMDHLLAAGDEEQAFATLRRNLVAAFHQRDGRMPSRLVAKIATYSTQIETARMPDLILALAAGGSPDKATPWIAHTSRHLSELTEVERARLAVASALVALQRGDPIGIEHAFSTYPTLDNFPDQELAEFVPGLLARSRLWLGDARGARRLCEESSGSFNEVSLMSQLAWVACVEGSLSEADQVATQALARAETMGLVGHPVMIEALCAQGRVAFERADLSTAESLFEKSLSISEDARPSLALVSQILLARVRLAEGHAGEAMDGILRARAFLPPESTSPLLRFCAALEGRVAVALGDLRRAERCVEQLQPGHAVSVMETRIAIARRAFDDARAALDTCVPTTLRERVDVTVLKARISCGDKFDDADAMLAGAVQIARAEGFVVAVADDLIDDRSRLALLLRSHRVGSYEAAVLERLEGIPPLQKSSPGEAGPLSERELTVVRYLASRLTMREIAAEIFVSTNTLKTHVRRIYGKLGVSSRTEAVIEARRLGVL